MSFGSGAGFLARVSSLEKEVAFLKQKVEDDARWKHVLQQWTLDNFAFDIQGALLKKQRSTSKVSKSSSSVPTITSIRSESGHRGHSNRKSTPKTRSKVPKNKSKTEPLSSSSEVDFPDMFSPGGLSDPDPSYLPDEGQGHSFGVIDNHNEMSVNPRDLIITPDACTDKTASRNSRKSPRDTKSGVVLLPQDPVHLDPIDSEREDQDQSSSESSSSVEEQRRTFRRMEWTLVSSYPNVETMKSQFNLREWALSTKQVSDKGVKIYYYCKECRKKGPGRLQIRYQDEESEVEILKNQLGHDHSSKRRMGQEMRAEILSLYQAGIKTSKEILDAVKISKPEMRQPTFRQVCYIIKTIRREERKARLKETKKLNKAKAIVNEEKKAAKAKASGAKKTRAKKGAGAATRKESFDFPLLPNFDETNLLHHPNGQPQLDSTNIQFEQPHGATTTSFHSQLHSLQIYPHASFDPNQSGSQQQQQHYHTAN